MIIKKYLNNLKLILLSFILIVNYNFVKAQNAPVLNLDQASAQLKAKLQNIFSLAFGAAGAIFVVMFLIGGLKYLTSAGNEESASKAKKLLMNAVIGIVIILSSYAIASYVLTQLGGTIPNELQP